MSNIEPCSSVLPSPDFDLEREALVGRVVQHLLIEEDVQFDPSDTHQMRICLRIC